MIKEECPYILALDLGTNSIGWAVLDATNGEATGIRDVGVHIFPEAGHDHIVAGKRELNNQERRKHRLARRSLRRRKARRHNLYRLFAQLELLPEDEIERNAFLCRHTHNGECVQPYYLRARAATEPIEPPLFARALCHLNQRRGYLSTADLLNMGIPRQYLRAADANTTLQDDAEAPQSEEQQERSVIKQGIRQAEEELRQQQVTFGQLMVSLMEKGIAARHYNKHKDGEKKRRRAVQYLDRRCSRWMLEDEFETMWQVQARAYPKIWTPELKKHIFQIIFYQRPLDWEAIQASRRPCPLYPGSKRAPKATLAFQCYRIIQNLIQLQVDRKANPEQKRLTTSEIEAVLPFLMQGHELEYDMVRKLAGLPEGDTISHTQVSRRHTPTSVKGNLSYAALRSAIGDDFDQLSEEQKKQLLHIRISVPFGRNRYRLYQNLGYDEATAAALALCPVPEGNAEYCTKALKKLAELMLENGLQQKQALDLFQEQRMEKIAGRTFEAETQLGDANKLSLPRDFDLRNPIVERAIRRTVWVVNQILHRYGKPVQIRVEMPRTMALSVQAKNKIYHEQNERNQQRNTIRQKLAELGLPTTDVMVKKYRLAEECGWRLPYEPNRGKIEPQDLASGDVEIDHVVPRSHLWDNSWRNLLLCTRDFNTNHKRNQTPWEMFQNSPEEWAAYVNFINSLRSMDNKKQQWVLSKERPESGFLNSQLVATGYLAKKAKALLETLGVRVVVSKGAMTDELRKVWQLHDLLPKWTKNVSRDPGEHLEILGKNRDDHRHHAIDAIIVGLTSASVGLRITKLYQNANYPNERIDLTPSCPIPNLRDEIAKRLKSMPITYHRKRQPSGSLNDATAKKLDPMSRAQSQNGERVRVEANRLLRFDATGQQSQAYPLGNNHHLVLYVSSSLNKNGAYDFATEVIPMIEAVRRKAHGEDVFQPNPRMLQQGMEVRMYLVPGDIVEWNGKHPGYYRVTTISQAPRLDFCMQILELAKSDPNLRNREVHDKCPIKRINSPKHLVGIVRRVELNLFGEVVYEVPNQARKL